MNAADRTSNYQRGASILAYALTVPGDIKSYESLKSL
jgi:hypothetical protein